MQSSSSVIIGFAFKVRVLIGRLLHDNLLRSYYRSKYGTQDGKMDFMIERE